MHGPLNVTFVLRLDSSYSLFILAVDSEVLVG